MFNKIKALGRSDALVLKISVAWGIWLVLGLGAWVFFPLSTDPTSQGFESLHVLAWVVTAQLPFAVVLLAVALRNWHLISSDYRFLSCSVLILALAAISGLIWYFSWL